MKTLPPNIILEKNKLATPNAWLILLEIALNDGTVLRFVRNTEDVFFTTDKYDDVGCVGHWKMNDNLADKIVIDSSGNGNTGASERNTNIIHVDGKINGALNFDGEDDYVVVANAAIFDFTTAFSVLTWINPTAVANSNGIVTKYLSIGDKREWALIFTGTVGADTKLLVLLGNAGGTGTTQETTDSLTISNGFWYRVGFTYNAGTVIIYVNGVAVASTTTGAHITSLNQEAIDLEIGRFNGSSYFDGLIDDTRIFNQELSAEEMVADYNNGAGTEYLRTKYTAFPFEIEPTRNMSKGQIPTVTLKVSNITNLLEPYLESLKGAIRSTVKVTVVNSARLTESYSELELNYDVIACNSTAQWVTFILGASNPLRQRFPLHKFLALHCRFQYKDIEDQIGPRCQYAGKVITGITKGATTEVNAENNGFEVDDVIKFADVGGMTEINGESGVVLDVSSAGNVFTVDIDSSAFSNYTSGGRCGYATCKKTLAECRERENSVNFGGFPGIRSGTVRIA